MLNDLNMAIPLCHFLVPTFSKSYCMDH